MSEYYSEYGRRKQPGRHPLMWHLDTLLAFATAAVAVTMALTLLVPYVDPGYVWIFPVLGLAAPATYAATVVLALYWIIRWRWGRAGLMLALVFAGCFRISLFYRPEWRRVYGEESYDRSAFKVMTYNVRCFFGGDGQSSVADVVRFIRETNADIVCLQEFNLRLAARDGGFEGLRDLYRDIRLFHADINDSTYSEPMAILSKYRILRSGEVSAAAASVWADLLMGEDTVRIFSNHLWSTSINADDDEFITRRGFLRDTAREEKMRSMFRRYGANCVIRAVQADSIAREIGATGTRRIVCGDFNDTPVSYVYRAMSRDLTDAFRACGRGYSHTFLGFCNLLRIDYVFSSEGLEPLSYEVPDVGFSDHLPVVVRLRKRAISD